MATKFKIVEDAKRQARLCFLGIAIPCDKSTVDGGTIRSEKILKFNRKALKNMNKSKADKVDPRMLGGEDTMILKVGQPGSRERVEALRLQYEAIDASGENLSPFGWEA
jgi:tRNA G37 N-methylase TrmD